MKQRYVSRKTLAKLLDTTPGALAMRAMRGQPPRVIKLSARKCVYDLREVEEWLERCKVKMKHED